MNFKLFETIRDIKDYLSHRKSNKRYWEGYMERIVDNMAYNNGFQSELAYNMAVKTISDTLTHWYIDKEKVSYDGEEIEIVLLLNPEEYSSCVIYVASSGVRIRVDGEFSFSMENCELQEIMELDEMVRYDMFDFVFNDWCDEEIRKHYD